MNKLWPQIKIEISMGEPHCEKKTQDDDGCDDFEKEFEEAKKRHEQPDDSDSKSDDECDFGN